MLDELVADLRPAWMAAAACRGSPTELFFPERGDAQAARDARAICSSCRVRAQCLDDALATEIGSRHGIRGGLAPLQRRRLARNNESCCAPTAVAVSEPKPVTAVEPRVVRVRWYAAAL